MNTLKTAANILPGFIVIMTYCVTFGSSQNVPIHVAQSAVNSPANGQAPPAAQAVPPGPGNPDNGAALQAQGQAQAPGPAPPPVPPLPISSEESIESKEVDYRRQVVTYLKRIADDLDEERMSNAIDCSNFFHAGERKSGVYKVRPTDRRLPFKVYCDLDTEDGGWTVIQRRGDYGNPPDYFNKNWTEYKNGFGDLEKEFWLGNEQINSLTSQGKYNLRINMVGEDGNPMNVQYSEFNVDGLDQKYKLKLSGFSGNVNFDSMALSSGQGFSTYDNDNDDSKRNCAEIRRGGWWYKDCANANLNGAKANSENSTFTWYVDGKGKVPLKSSEMKIRPKPAESGGLLSL